MIPITCPACSAEMGIAGEASEREFNDNGVAVQIVTCPHCGDHWEVAWNAVNPDQPVVLGRATTDEKDWGE